MKKRLNYIDIAKCIAITCIVLSHTVGYSTHLVPLRNFLYSFHVALFFMISGYLFKTDKEYLDFVKNKFIRIMIPYFIWGLLFLIPYMIFSTGIKSSLNINAISDIKELILNTLYGNGNNFHLKQNSALWFLPALFTMEVIYYFIIRFSNKHSKYDLITFITILLINIITSTKLKFILPWGLNTTLNISIFFYIGYLLNKYKILDKIKPIFIPLLILIGVIGFIFNTQKITYMNYGYGIIYYALLSGIFLSISILIISKLINKNNILEYIGKNTMSILIFHKIVLLIFQSKLGFISKKLINSNILIELLISIVCVIISIILSLIIAAIIRKFIPQLIGEKKEA